MNSWGFRAISAEFRPSHAESYMTLLKFKNVISIFFKRTPTIDFKTPAYITALFLHQYDLKVHRQTIKTKKRQIIYIEYLEYICYLSCFTLANLQIWSSQREGFFPNIFKPNRPALSKSFRLNKKSKYSVPTDCTVCLLIPWESFCVKISRASSYLLKEDVKV